MGDLQTIRDIVTMVGVVGSLSINIYVQIRNGQKAEAHAVVQTGVLQETKQVMAETKDVVVETHDAVVNIGPVIDGISEKTDGRLTSAIEKATEISVQLDTLRVELASEKQAGRDAAVANAIATEKSLAAAAALAELAKPHPLSEVETLKAAIREVMLEKKSEP